MIKKILFALVALMSISVCAQNDKAYVFSYFDNKDESAGLCLAYSYDGYHWTAVKGGQSLLSPKVGKDKLMRDPSICKGPDGLFHMVWTTSWNDSIIGVAHSMDLIHWSEQESIPVMKNYPTVRNSWAPEIFYDKKSKRYFIFWASTVPGSTEVNTVGEQCEDNYGHRIYCTTTKDFVKYSKTTLYFNPAFSAIDAAIVQDPQTGELIMTVKNENLVPEEKNIRVTRSRSMKKGFPIEVSAPIHGKYWCEGPSPLYVGNDLLVYFDMYRDHRYGAVRSKDHGKTWEDISDQITMPKDMRHGTALEVDKAIVEALKKL